MPLQLIRQDITQMHVDAIVNPSNEDLWPGGSTDLAIHQAAGRELLIACQTLGGCRVGQAKITDGYDLPCRYVIHTVGPVWENGESGEEENLISCYRNALELAKEYQCESIAFPLISSGTYGYPKDQVLAIATRTISEFLFEHEMMVYLLVYDKESYELSKKVFSEIDSYLEQAEVKVTPELCASMPSVRMAYDEVPVEVDDGVCYSLEDSVSLEEALRLDETFSVRLLKLIDAKGMTEVECYKKANVSKQTWYKIMNEKDYRPNRKTVISFAVALELTLSETQDLMETVGFVLSNSSKFDLIIRYCIERGIYDVLEIDAILFQYDQELLYAKA